MRSILYIGNKLSHHGPTPGVIETLGPLLEFEGYKVYYAGTKKNKALRFAEMVFRTLTVGRSVNYILIDTYSTAAFWFAYLISMMANMMGKRYLPILHGGDLPARLKKSRHACDSLFLNSYTNVAVSGYLKHEFEKVRYKTIVIPNNIDISKYPFKLREHTRPKLLWVRSFHRQYNPKMAADVLVELLKNYPESELCMVGPDKDGSMAEFRDYIKHREIEKYVRITGMLSKEEWILLSADYDFFINTTNVDNTPVSVIEAMALGFCVISTDPGGIPYLLNDGFDSCLVRPDDVMAMTSRITGLLTEENTAKKMSASARSKAESFDWKQVRQKWIELLK